MSGYKSDTDSAPRPLTAAGLGLALGMLLAGCDAAVETAAPPEAAAGQVSLPWGGRPFDLLLDDLDGDGRLDITAIDHGANAAPLFLQKKPRVFTAGPPFTGVGFHPGTLITWPEEPRQFILGAEGDNAIRALLPDAEAGFRVQSNLRERAPRYARLIAWPGWGRTLAVSPYANGYIVLLKGYDPLKGEAAARVVVPLAEQANTIRAAERVTAADLDGDATDELLIVISATGELLQVRYPGADPGAKPEVTVLYQDETWGMPNEAHALDLDADGDNDVLLPDEAPPGRINVLWNDGKGRFQPGTPIATPLPNGVTELRAARDHDGVNYLLAAGPGAVALYRLPAGWRDGESIPMQHLAWPADYTAVMKLQDMDGDGWLDGVLGRTNSQRNIWVVYGPLWERFEALAGQGFVLR